MAMALHAALRPLTGADELLVHEAVAAGTARAVIATKLLAVALDPGGEALAEGLSVGQRETLLLRLRRGTFGERIEAMVACPHCREPLDVELQTAELLSAATDPPVEAVEASVHADGSQWRARLRAVTGADQTAALGMADPITAMLRSCVEGLMRDDGVAWPVEQASSGLRAALDAALRDVDPSAETSLELACAACGEQLRVPFDAAGHFFAEIVAEGDLLLREVATLARLFHWREQDILALPRGRRKAYAALVAGR